MASDDLTGRIHALFLQALNIEVPNPQTDLIESGLLDSLALVELLFQIEQDFGVDLSLDELEIDDFQSVERIAEFVARRRQVGASTGP